MSRQRIYLIIGIVLGLLAIFLINIHMQQERQRIIEKAKRELARIQENSVAVLVAKHDIPAGTQINSEMIDTAIVPKQYLVPQAVTSLDRISGMVTIAQVARGEQISLSKLSYPKERETGGSLAGSTPIGKRAITISVDNIGSLAGMIRAGDYVDVFAVLSIPVQTPDGKSMAQQAVIPLFQNVLVLAVGQQLGGVSVSGGRYKKEEKAEASPLITLALTPQEANLLAFVQEQGKIRLTLRSPADSQIQMLQPASWETLFSYIMPKLPQQEEPKEEKPKEEKRQEPTAFVEIYRGLSKERVPIK